MGDVPVREANKGGMRKHPMYGSYAAMKNRCYNPNASDYYLYGGRGIAVCEQWMESFWSFLQDMGERPEGMTLDRIDPDGDYEPGNCRWATPAEQRHNQTEDGKERQRKGARAGALKRHQERAANIR